MDHTKLAIHDYRKIYSNIYQIKPEMTIIQQLPELKYISQRMKTAYNMDWDGCPEPIDEKWIAWKVVNQVKEITKKELAYKFKRMPPEIIWHKQLGDDKWLVDQMLLVSNYTTEEIYDRALERVKKKLQLKNLNTISFVISTPKWSASRLHIGHYKDTDKTLQTILQDVTEQGYQVSGLSREIFLKPSMACYPPEKCHTIVSVEVEKIG